VFAELLQRIDDADEQALAAYAAAPPPPATPEQQLRAQIHLLVIDAGLQRRHAEFTATRDRGHLDALVAAVLGVLPQQEAFAEPLGRARLAGRPFLGAGHEAAVLALVALAGEHGFPLPVATELLRTLWHNLEQQGVRSSGELTSLALLLLQDQNPAKRLCACTELLRSERYRPLVLELARAGKDESFATDVALAAAQTLPPETALASLQELLPSSSRLLAAFLTIGNRDATAMRSAYERRLADDTDPGFRAELITGAGFTRTPEGLALARLAFDSDPHLEVRTRAMFALTANAAESLGETAIHTLLDLPEFARDPARLGAAVLALENLERKGQINAIDRLGQRLRTCSALLAGDRANLERILARSLPGGRTSR